jgi:hypothetical protein
MEVPEFLKEIANAFGSIAGVEAVAWCGSAAMGVADAHSDFDFMFTPMLRYRSKAEKRSF